MEAVVGGASRRGMLPYLVLLAEVQSTSRAQGGGWDLTASNLFPVVVVIQNGDNREVVGLAYCHPPHRAPATLQIQLRAAGLSDHVVDALLSSRGSLSELLLQYHRSIISVYEWFVSARSIDV